MSKHFGISRKLGNDRKLEALIEDQVIRQAPAGTDADYFILEIAEQQDAYVVSNDEFERWRHQYPWIERRRVLLMIVKGQVELYEKLGV